MGCDAVADLQALATLDFRERLYSFSPLSATQLPGTSQLPYLPATPYETTEIVWISNSRTAASRERIPPRIGG